MKPPAEDQSLLGSPSYRPYFLSKVSRIVTRLLEQNCLQSELYSINHPHTRNLIELTTFCTNFNLKKIIRRGPNGYSRLAKLLLVYVQKCLISRLTWRCAIFIHLNSCLCLSHI